MPRGRPPIEAAPQQLQKVGAIALRWYDRDTGGTPRDQPRFAKVVWGDCTNRDGVVRADPLTSASSSVGIYGQRADRLCLVTQQAAESSVGELCDYLPAWIAPPSARSEPSAVIGMRGRDFGVPCPKPSPWTITFVDHKDGHSPINPTILAEATSGMTIHNVPLVPKAGGWSADLRREHLVAISKRQDGFGGSNWQRVLAIKGVYPDFQQQVLSIHVEPQVFALAGKEFIFKDLQGNDADRCVMTLDVAPSARWGSSWSALEQQGGTIVLQPEGGPRYSLSVKGAQGRRVSNVDLNRLFVRRGGDANDLSIRLIHSNAQSEANCFLPVANITGPDLEAGSIARTVGKPQPALIRFVTVDGAYESSGLNKEDYELALERTIDHTTEIGRLISMAEDLRPYLFHATAVIQDGQAKALPATVPRGLDLDRETYGTVISAIQRGVAARAVGTDPSKLRSYVGDMFRGQQGDIDRQPADIIHIGRVIGPRGDDRFCNQSAQSTVSSWRQSWLSSETRHLLEIAFAGSDTISKLVAAGDLVPMPDARRQTVFACKYNVPGYVEQLVVDVPLGQRRGADEIETKQMILQTVQKLFRVRRVN